MKKYFEELGSNKRFWLLPLIAFMWNEFVYYAGRILTSNRTHYEFAFDIERKIPLIPWTVLIYFLCFLVWAIVYLYMATRERKSADDFFRADWIGKLICLFFFLFLPTTMRRPEITGDGFWNIIMQCLYKIDSADNLFPSIHCMVSWFCWIGLRNQKECPMWCKCGMLLFAIAVCISTLTTKQHVVVDVVGGVLFAEISYMISKQFVRKRIKL